jgi:fatty acid synthase
MVTQNNVHFIPGPSYSVDTACSSSACAFEQAYKSICDKRCDAAIVGGSQLSLHPYLYLLVSHFGLLSPQGTCRTFDKDGKHSSPKRFI